MSQTQSEKHQEFWTSVMKEWTENYLPKLETPEPVEPKNRTPAEIKRAVKAELNELREAGVLEKSFERCCKNGAVLVHVRGILGVDEFNHRFLRSSRINTKCIAMAEKLSEWNKQTPSKVFPFRHFIQRTDVIEDYMKAFGILQEHESIPT